MSHTAFLSSLALPSRRQQVSRPEAARASSFARYAAPAKTRRARPNGLLSTSMKAQSHSGAAGEDGDDIDEELVAAEFEAASRILNDPNTSRTIAVLIEKVVPVKGVDYFVTTPRDRPIVIARVDDPAGSPVALQEGEVGLEGMEKARQALSDSGIKLIQSAFVLTIDETFEEEEEDDEDDEIDEDDEDNEGVEKVELITSFPMDDKEFLVVAPVDPILLIGKESPTDPDALVMPPESELAQVQSLIEKAMMDDDADTFEP